MDLGAGGTAHILNMVKQNSNNPAIQDRSLLSVKGIFVERHFRGASGATVKRSTFHFPAAHRGHLPHKIGCYRKPL
jgi:hypothetical protein